MSPPSVTPASSHYLISLAKFHKTLYTSDNGYFIGITIPGAGPVNKNTESASTITITPTNPSTVASLIMTNVQSLSC